MDKFIICCSCRNMPKFAQEAYSILFPDSINPELVSGPSHIYKLADQYPNSEFQKYLKGLARSKDKFAYYFLISPAGEIDTVINLKTGARVA